MLAVFLVEYADKTLKTEEEIERYSGVQILGRIPQIQDLKDELHVKASPISPESEAIKMAASNISFILGDKKILCYHFGKPFRREKLYRR